MVRMDNYSSPRIYESIYSLTTNPQEIGGFLTTLNERKTNEWKLCAHRNPHKKNQRQTKNVIWRKTFLILDGYQFYILNGRKQQMNDRLELKDRNKPTPFNSWNKTSRAKKYFRDDTKIRRQGEDINLQQFLNENNKDCTIYQVLDTYRGDKKLTTEVLNKMSHKVIDELQEIKDLPTAFEAMNLAEKSWRNLPLDVRKEFNHDIKNFQKNGMLWANNKIKEHKEYLKSLETLEITKQNKGDTSNG